jgi:hypothetical protein
MEVIMQKLQTSIRNVTPDLTIAGLKAFFKIMDTWEVKPQEAIILLGHPARSTFFKWKRGSVDNVPYDAVKRISYILGIYKALQILFTENARADSWVRKPSKDFGGQSALERMLGGDVTDLAYIREYLDSVRGGGWS